MWDPWNVVWALLSPPWLSARELQVCALLAAVILAGLGARAEGTWRAIDLVLGGYCVLMALAATILLRLRRRGNPEA